MEFLLFISVGMIFGGFSRVLATIKGFSGLNWFLAGFFFGPIGFLAAVGLPDANRQDPILSESERFRKFIDQ